MGIIPTRNLSLCLFITFCVGKKRYELHIVLLQRPLLIQPQNLSSPYAHLLRDFLSTVLVICSISWPLTWPLTTRFLLDAVGRKRRKTSNLLKPRTAVLVWVYSPLKCIEIRPLMSCLGRADTELVTVRVPYNLVIVLEDSWRMEETLASCQSVGQALHIPSLTGLATALPFLFMVPEGKCQFIQTFTNLF